MKVKDDEPTRPADVSIADLKRTIASYYALWKDGCLQDVSNQEMTEFKMMINKNYSLLNDDEKAQIKEIKANWKYHDVAYCALG